MPIDIVQKRRLKMEGVALAMQKLQAAYTFQVQLALSLKRITPLLTWGALAAVATVLRSVQDECTRYGLRLTDFCVEADFAKSDGQPRENRSNPTGAATVQAESLPQFG